MIENRLEDIDEKAASPELTSRHIPGEGEEGRGVFYSGISFTHFKIIRAILFLVLPLTHVMCIYKVQQSQTNSKSEPCYAKGV